MKLIVKSLGNWKLFILAFALAGGISFLLVAAGGARPIRLHRPGDWSCLHPCSAATQLRSSGYAAMRASTSDIASPAQRLHRCGWKSLYACAASALQPGSDEYPCASPDANAGANVNLHRHANDLLYYAQGNCNTNTSRVGDSNQSIYLSQGNCDISRRYPGAIHPASQTGHAEVAAGTVGRISFQSCQSVDQQAFSGQVSINGN